MLLEEQTWFKSGGLKPDSDSYLLSWPETVSLFLWRQELITLKRDRKRISFCSTMCSIHVSLHFLFLLKPWTKKLIELWPKIRVHLMYELGRGVSMLIGSRFFFFKYGDINVVSTYVSESRSVVSDSLRPHELYSPWNSPGHNTGVSILSLLQGIFPTQGLNPHLLHCRWILYKLSLIRNTMN